MVRKRLSPGQLSIFEHPPVNVIPGDRHRYSEPPGKGGDVIVWPSKVWDHQTARMYWGEPPGTFWLCDYQPEDSDLGEWCESGFRASKLIHEPIQVGDFVALLGKRVEVVAINKRIATGIVNEATKWNFELSRPEVKRYDASKSRQLYSHQTNVRPFRCRDRPHGQRCISYGG